MVFEELRDVLEAVADEEIMANLRFVGSKA